MIDHFARALFGMARAMARPSIDTEEVIKPPAPRLYKTWQKAVDDGVWQKDRWPNFSTPELACNCGRFCKGEYYHDVDFLDRLQAMRTDVGRPFVINSGHRCTLWNASVGGAARSKHKEIAADISLNRHDPAQLLTAALKVGFNGIGFGASFIHVDRRDYSVAWGYGPFSKKVWSVFDVVFDASGRRVTGIPKLFQGE